MSWIYAHRQTWVWSYGKLLQQQAEGTALSTQKTHSNLLFPLRPKLPGEGRLGGRKEREEKTVIRVTAGPLTAGQRLTRSLAPPVGDGRLLLNVQLQWH